MVFIGNCSFMHHTKLQLCKIKSASRSFWWLWHDLEKINADDPDAINESAFESAENMVIDERIKDVAKGVFINEDIV